MDGKRFEDYVSVEDLERLEPQVLMAKIYVQTLKTNGAVAQNCKDIADLQIEIKDKIGVKELLRFEKLFGIIAAIGAFILLVFNIWDRLPFK